MFHELVATVDGSPRADQGLNATSEAEARQ
jgi:hypothetical protein